MWDFHGRGKHLHINGYVNNNLLDYKSRVLKRKLFGRIYILKVIWVLREMFYFLGNSPFTGWCVKFTLVIGPIKMSIIVILSLTSWKIIIGKYTFLKGTLILFGGKLKLLAPNDAWVAFEHASLKMT